MQKEELIKLLEICIELCDSNINNLLNITPTDINSIKEEMTIKKCYRRLLILLEED